MYGYGFVESLTIIFLYNATGYIPILGNYGLQTQPHKNAIVKELVSNETWGLVTYKGGSQPMPPDVFVYAPDKSDFFFCEVKGPSDRLRAPQVKYFQQIQETSGKLVYTVKYRFAPFNKK